MRIVTQEGDSTTDIDPSQYKSLVTLTSIESFLFEVSFVAVQY